MKISFSIIVFIMVSTSIFAWVGIEDETITGYPSLFSSLLLRALEDKSYVMNDTVKEVSITNNRVKQSYGQEVEETDSNRILSYKNGKLIEDKTILPDGNIQNRIEYSYNEKGLIKATISYEGNETIAKRSEYKYNDDGTKIEYTAFDNSGRIRVKHKYIYSIAKEKKNITDEKIYNSAGINVLSIKYEYDDKNNLTSSTFFDYNGDFMRREDYVYNSFGKAIKLTTVNELNDKDGEFEYIYNNENKLEQILFRRPFNDEGLIVFKFSYAKNGIIIEKNTYLVTDRFGDSFEQKLNRSIWNHKIYNVNEEIVSKEKEKISQGQIEKTTNDTDKNKKNEIKNEPIEMKKNKNIEEIKNDELISRVTMFYKNSSLKKQNKSGKEYYEIYNEKNKIAAYVFIIKNFGYSGEIISYIIIDITGAVKDVHVSDNSTEKDETIQILKNKNWFSKFNKIEIKNVDISKRDFKEKIDGAAGATVTSDSIIISMWKAIAMYNNIKRK